MDWSPEALKVCMVCDLIFCVAILGGCAYAVFWLGQNGWWFALAFFMCACWSCKPFRSPAQIEADAE